ncbi:terminal organelle protein HMW3 [Mycoplasmoides genitalium]|uniref:Cytadherence high molecular weight protein 3 n=1 Tax=Mycoplasma genitalium (strain ATCC 33530 / DSM 19775 / NCTC 10195 / G37) TaxID=243273 RepID=HMW3_MYCGE|nr:terminal organelle protein HMW3 [Mycoplasmoides genitalium]Q57081.1 RecName: Full=Cytadherence high molecular weight protein 3; AltName: Full=Accessory adhesin protein 3; AltName: Full=Cytadherence accessory protein 3; AltName: Full=P69 [Mycoplasmoides genitalium G37]AAA99946.1 69kDa protein [Mycoplasmoides genitalium]AAC71539.1 HMW3 cytadherence accessory protein [Mycoplasmoides genitalium G37]ABY79603.1 HMW3 cytadherence accessory protein [synthetic Mycoplasma genitalium JCVI-1.0]
MNDKQKAKINKAYNKLLKKINKRYPDVSVVYARDHKNKVHALYQDPESGNIFSLEKRKQLASNYPLFELTSDNPISFTNNIVSLNAYDDKNNLVTVQYDQDNNTFYDQNGNVLDVSSYTDEKKVPLINYLSSTQTSQEQPTQQDYPSIDAGLPKIEVDDQPKAAQHTTLETESEPDVFELNDSLNQPQQPTENLGDDQFVEKEVPPTQQLHQDLVHQQPVQVDSGSQNHSFNNSPSLKPPLVNKPAKLVQPEVKHIPQVEVQPKPQIVEPKIEPKPEVKHVSHVEIQPKPEVKPVVDSVPEVKQPEVKHVPHVEVQPKPVVDLKPQRIEPRIESKPEVIKHIPQVEVQPKAQMVEPRIEPKPETKYIPQVESTPQVEVHHWKPEVKTEYQPQQPLPTSGLQIKVVPRSAALLQSKLDTGFQPRQVERTTDSDITVSVSSHASLLEKINALNHQRIMSDIALKSDNTIKSSNFSRFYPENEYVATKYSDPLYSDTNQSLTSDRFSLDFDYTPKSRVNNYTPLRSTNFQNNAISNYRFSRTPSSYYPLTRRPWRLTNISSYRSSFHSPTRLSSFRRTSLPFSSSYDGLRRYPSRSYWSKDF